MSTETAAGTAPAGPSTEFGTELILDLAGCSPMVVRSADALAHWAISLADRIGMKTWGQPIVQRFGEGSLYGVTVIQLISTSNITVHGVNADSSAFINVFSCRPFDVADAAKFTIDYFKAAAARATHLHRAVPEVGVYDLAGFAVPAGSTTE